MKNTYVKLNSSMSFICSRCRLKQVARQVSHNCVKSVVAKRPQNSQILETFGVRFGFAVAQNGMQKFQLLNVRIKIC